MQNHGPWEILSSREVYRDPWLDVRVDNVLRPDGLPGTYSTVRLKPGICVIAQGDHGELYLTREFHYAVGRETIEGVSGGIEVDETPLQSAERELREEIGIVAQDWVELGWVDPFTSAIASPTRLFLASQLTFVPPANEGTERIERVCTDLDQALQWMEQGIITHAPTCVCLLKIALKLARQKNKV